MKGFNVFFSLTLAVLCMSVAQVQSRINNPKLYCRDCESAAKSAYKSAKNDCRQDNIGDISATKACIYEKKSIMYSALATNCYDNSNPLAPAPCNPASMYWFLGIPGSGETCQDVCNIVVDYNTCNVDAQNSVNSPQRAQNLVQNAFPSDYALLISLGYDSPQDVADAKPYNPYFVYSATQSPDTATYNVYGDGTVSSDCTVTNTALDLPSGVTLDNPAISQVCCCHPDTRKCPVDF